MTPARKATPTSSRQHSQTRRFVNSLEVIMERTMHLNRSYTDAMLQISPPEMRGLMWLARRGRSVMSDFAQGMDIPLSTATRIVNRLVNKGIVVRHRSEKDRRLVEIDLSENAYEHRNRFIEARQAALLRILEPLAAAERITLLDLLEKGLRLSEPAASTTPKAPLAKKISPKF